MRLNLSIGNSIGLTAGLLLSTDALLIRLISIDNTWLLVILRGMLMWFSFLMVYFFRSDWRKIIGQPWPTKNTVIPIIFFSVASTCFIHAISNSNTSVALVIISATPIFSVFISRLFFNIKINKSTLITAAIGIFGVWFVMYGNLDTTQSSTILFSIATAVSMALAFIFSEKTEGGRVGLPSLGAVVASVVIFIFSDTSIKNLIDVLISYPTGLWVLLEGIIVMPLSLGLLALATRYVPASNVGLFLLLETALAPLWIWISFNEQLSAYTIVGGTIIVASLVSHSFYTSRLIK